MLAAITVSPLGGLFYSAHVFWPNGWMDQYATWYGGRPQPWPHCVRWGPIPPPQKKVAQLPSLFGPCLCGQTAAHLSYC